MDSVTCIIYIPAVDYQPKVMSQEICKKYNQQQYAHISCFHSLYRMYNIIYLIQANQFY